MFERKLSAPVVFFGIAGILSVLCGIYFAFQTKPEGSPSFHIVAGMILFAGAAWGYVHPPADEDDMPAEKPVRRNASKVQPRGGAMVYVEEVVEETYVARPRQKAEAPKENFDNRYESILREAEDTGMDPRIVAQEIRALRSEEKKRLTDRS